MAKENNISTQLNDLLVTQDFHPEMMDKNGQPANADDAKTFSFDYISKSGKNYGTMVIVLGNDNEMQVMYGDNLGKTMEGNDKDDFFNFTQQLHNFATRNFWNYTPQDLSKLRHVQAGIAAIQEGLFEGYYGNRRVSYSGEPTEARLMIKHNQTLGENDARFRHVESIFIETADQERFKLPFTNLSGARAMLEHVKQGGKPYDVRGNHICEMVTELKVLNRFNRASKGRVSEGVTKELVEGAQAYYKTLRESLKHLGTSRGYNNYFETWTPLAVTEQDKLVEDIKTLFVEQTIDTRIEAALPLLARIQQGNAMKEAQIFENWINNITEGTWSLPDTPEQQEKLKELMAQPLPAGPDGTNATEQLYDIIGDDQLFDAINAVADRDPDANIWDDEGVQRRLEDLGIYVVNPTEGDEVAPVSDTQDTGVPDGGQIAPAAPVPPVQEDIAAIEESLRSMLKHAGVPVAESRIIDESGETLQHILDRFKFEVKSFEDGGELDNDLYDALYDYYASSGSMPYGVAKARTGDPFEWVTEKLDQELGTGNYAPRLPEADNIAAFEAPLDEFIGMAAVGEGTGTCNHTMEGEYCPEHGLAECGTTAGGMAPVVMGEMDKPPHDDPINSNSAITGSYYESKDGDAMLARIKSLALLK